MRLFLDWSRPCLPAAADVLVRRIEQGSDAHVRNGRSDAVAGRESRAEGPPLELDLSRVVCLLPGARAGRLLLAELLDHAERAGRLLIPPRIATPGAAAAMLLDSGQPAATLAEAAMAWRCAVEACSAETLRPILFDFGADDSAERRSLAELLAGLSETLAAGERTFADVARVIEATAPLREVERWQTLCELEAAYLDVLHRHGLEDPMRAVRRAAERCAVREGIEHIVLIGVVDLNARTRRVIEACSDRVIALVHAPESLAGRFDELGCIIIDEWEEHEIDLSEAVIHFVERPIDQAKRAVRHLCEVRDAASADPATLRESEQHRIGSGESRPAPIVVGLGDPSLQPSLLRCAAWAGLRLHPAAGVPLRGSPPLLLLERAANWLEERRFSDLAALLRLPDVEHWLHQHAPAHLRHAGSEHDTAGAVGRWLGLVEAYLAEHLQQRCTGKWLGNEHDAERLRQVHRSIEELLREFDDDEQRPIGHWAACIRRLIIGVFGHHLRPESRTWACCVQMSSTLEELATIHPALQPDVTAVEALRDVWRLVERGSAPVEVGEDEIDMLGWLELHLDSAPELVLVGCNDGTLPQTVTGHAFLPDSLRALLGLPHNAQRHARDAYLLSAISHSRRVVLVVGRRGADDEPLTPSRLLFHADDEAILARVRAFCRAGEAAGAGRSELPAGLPPSAEVSQFIVPALPDQVPPPESMRITDFRTYLGCPYRFALARLLRLTPTQPPVEELDPMRFGTLAHEALESFGRSDRRDSTDAERITRSLHDEVDRIVHASMGGDIYPAVQVQIAHLKQRLRDFARRQARWRDEGWEIVDCEIECLDTVQLDIPGQRGIGLRGRIDRLDRHATTGEWRVIDYKTSESGASPYTTHHGSKRIPADPENRWRDLQLPLYHYLLRCSGVIEGERRVHLGYVVLPRTSDGVAFHTGEWSDELLDEAIEVARGVVRRIREGQFELNTEFAGHDDYARICQTAVMQFNDPEVDVDDDDETGGDA